MPLYWLAIFLGLALGLRLLVLLLDIRSRQMAFSDSMATLTADVAKLIAEGGPGAVAAAVAAKDAADAAAVDALDATVKAALTPTPAP